VKDVALREIFVKAVCARGRETFQRTHRFRAKYHPEEILGAQITNPRVRATYETPGVRISGTYDVHVWYSYAGGGDSSHDHMDTAVAVQTFDYSAPVPVDSLIEDLSTVQNPEVRVQALRPPRVKDCTVDADGVIHVTVEDGHAVQVVGDTTLWVPVYAGTGSDDYLKKSDDELWEALQDAEEAYDDDLDIDDDFDWAAEDPADADAHVPGHPNR